MREREREMMIMMMILFRINSRVQAIKSFGLENPQLKRDGDLVDVLNLTCSVALLISAF